MRRSWIWASAVLIAVAGCAGATDRVPSSAAAASWGTRIDAILADAREGGAGERQLEVLREARRTGSLSYDTTVDLVRDTFGCFEASGIGYEEQPAEERAPGWKVVRYSFRAEAPGLSESHVKTLADACMAEHSMYAEFVLQDVGLHQDARDRRMRAELPTILACLAENGVRMDADATLDEIRRATLELLNATADLTEPAACWDDLATTPS